MSLQDPQEPMFTSVQDVLHAAAAFLVLLLIVATCLAGWYASDSPIKPGKPGFPADTTIIDWLPAN